MTAKKNLKPTKPVLLGVRAIATQLQLAQWQVRLAYETHLLPADDRNKVEASYVDAAEANRNEFLKQLDAMTPVNLAEAANLLGVSTSRAKKAIDATHLLVVKSFAEHHSATPHWRKRDITGKAAAYLASDTTSEGVSERGKKAKATGMSNAAKRAHGKRAERVYLDELQSEARRKQKEAAERHLQEVAMAQVMNIRILTGEPGPATFIVHAGPTNSGKTHMALAALAEHGRGVYAGPLRMLAREAYEKLSAMLGEQKVGLITGEEQINPDAPIICATAEAAPIHTGGILVLDECHWISDPQRGWAWTRLLIAGRFHEVHAIMDPAAVGLVVSLVPDAAETTIIEHPRLSHIKYAGKIPVERMPAGSAVVAFSRVSVLAIARKLSEAGRKPAVLYGALPPIARIAQVERLISGDADIIVTTDVIGHGINLPLTAVALAETQKFDGVVRRQLYLWEAAQILGRAGRYGHGTEVGETYSVTGEEWFTSPPSFIEAATSAAGGHTGTGWKIPDTAPIRPTLGELRIENAEDIPNAVRAFAYTTQRAAARIPVKPFDDTLVQERLSTILPLLRSDRQHSVPIETLWGLTMCPIDDLELIGIVTGVLMQHRKASERLTLYVQSAQVKHSTPLLAAEKAATAARNLRAITMSVGNLLGLSMADTARLEKNAGEAVTRALLHAGSTAGYGLCDNCGESCPPWFDTCGNCHQSNRWGY